MGGCNGGAAEGKQGGKEEKKCGREIPGGLPISVLSFTLGKLNKEATC